MQKHVKTEGKKGEKMTTKKILSIAIISCVLLCVAIFAAEITGVTFRATGLEVSQINDEIRASWDEMDCEEYLVAVFDDEGLVEKASVNDNSYSIKGTESNKEYKVQVAAKDEDGQYSNEDTVLYETKTPQTITVTGSEGDVFTSNEFTINAETDGKGDISFKSENKDVARVSRSGEVTIKDGGRAEIVVSAAETENMAAAETVVVVNSGETYQGEMPELPNAITSEAFKCAWPYGTAKSVYKYNGGTSTSHFKAAIDRAYPDHNRWGGTQPGKGASCDVFVGTVVRASGYDPNFPRALKGDYSYLPKSSKFKRVSPSQIQSGDIMLRKGHIQIYVEDENGTGYIANAHFKLKTYGIIEKRNPSLSGYAIYHPTGECTTPLSEGEQGEDVKKAQKFLAWAGYYDKKIDGKFGANVTEAVKAFQKDSGTDVTGNFGNTCISKAKKYTRNSIEIVQEEN